MFSSLVGKTIQIFANDFVDANSNATIKAISESGTDILLELERPLVSEGLEYEHVLVSNRYKGQSIRTLIEKERLTCGAYWVPTVQFNVRNPFDVSWWKAGAAAIVTIGELR